MSSVSTMAATLLYQLPAHTISQISCKWARLGLVAPKDSTSKTPGNICKTKTPACPPTQSSSLFLLYYYSFSLRWRWGKSACPSFLFPFLCLYMYVCVSRKQSDKQHPDVADGTLRPVFLTLLPEPVTPATLLWGGCQSRPQPVLIPEETQ